MSDKPTFHVSDDYVALMELRPAERTVYMLLRCNAKYVRQGVAEHAVHVTSSWFTEMTQHWENPMPTATARRAMNGLIKKGVLVRLNDPHDGSGFVVAFVADPRGRIDGPVNGFKHAERVHKRCGNKVYYNRRDDLPGDPAVTGVRLGKPKFRWNHELQDTPSPASSVPDDDRDLFPALPQDAEPEDHPEMPQESFEQETDILAEVEAEVLSPEVEELAEALERKTSRLNTPGHRLTRDQCRLVAQECAPALALGWDPAMLAQRMINQMGPKIHTPTKFLPKKAAELGAPPMPQQAPPSPRTPRPVLSPATAPSPEEAAKAAASGPAMEKFQAFWAERQRIKNAGQG